MTAGTNRALRRGAWVVAALALGAALWLALAPLFETSGPARKQVVQQIQLVRPPPPPPPKEPVKPPQMKPREEVRVDQPKPEPQQQARADEPPSPQLGLDVQGGAGGDAFGLVGRPGGRDIITLGKEGGPGGGIGGAGRLQFAFYTNQLQQRVQEEISRNHKLREGDYRAVVLVWVGRDGRIQKVDVRDTSGDATRDRLIQSALSAMAPMREPPPENMPQPVQLRITSRIAG